MKNMKLGHALSFYMHRKMISYKKMKKILGISKANVCYEKTDTLLLLYTEAKVYQFFRNRRYNGF